jgi:hypothetical protein
MKLTSLSKSVRSFGLIAMLSVLVTTTLQQPIQAQTVAKDKNGVCTTLPEGVFYQEFGGITFSPAQKAAYRKIEAKINKRYKVISDNTRPVVLPGAGLSMYPKPKVFEEKASEINAAMSDPEILKLSTAQQIEVLTKKYGKYATFSFAEALVYTPKQIAEGKRIGRDFEAQTMAILTPNQQKIYKVNLALQQRIQACVEPDNIPFDRIISPLPY